MTLSIEKIIESYVKKITLKQMLTVPAILLLLSLSILGYMYFSTGSPVELGMEFKGGTAIIFDSAKTPDELKAEFQGYPVIQAREYGGAGRKFIQFGPMAESLQEKLTAKVNSEYSNPEIRQMGEVVSKPLQEQALRAIIFSFI